MPWLPPNEAEAASQAYVNKPEDEIWSWLCAIDVSYARWQFQDTRRVPSVIVSFSPGRILSEYPLTTSDVKHSEEGRERWS